MQTDPDLVNVTRVARTFGTDPLPWLLDMTPAQFDVLVAAHNAAQADEQSRVDRARAAAAAAAPNRGRF